jgi:hypothetical protein
MTDPERLDDVIAGVVAEATGIAGFPAAPQFVRVGHRLVNLAHVAAADLMASAPPRDKVVLLLSCGKEEVFYGDEAARWREFFGAMEGEDLVHDLGDGDDGVNGFDGADNPSRFEHR